MKVLLASGSAVLAVAVVVAWLFFGVGQGADTGKLGPGTAVAVETLPRLIVHEWGTFTSFSGSDGVPVGFQPNNNDLPDFVYFQEGEKNSKEARLARAGLVSMETPVIYCYLDGFANRSWARKRRSAPAPAE